MIPGKDKKDISQLRSPITVKILRLTYLIQKYLNRARSSWQQLPLATLLPFARLLYFNVETLPFARITIRNTVTIRQVLRDWHHRPIFLALKSLQFASFFPFPANP